MPDRATAPRDQKRELATGEVLAAGHRIDHFEIMRLLGRGGMGEVYVARDVKLGRKVALKLVHPKHLGSEEAMASFMAEARTTAKFSHPHIVMIHAVGEYAGRPYVALEYLEGDNLRKRMLEHRPSLQASLRIVLAVAEALEEAHRGGVLHLDLKPENVMIPPDGRVRVVDFGLARPVPLKSGPLESGKVMAGSGEDGHLEGLWGTPGYMAPEQWRREEVSSATDVWALGMLLFELCSDWLPYDLEGSKSALMRAVCAPEPVPSVERYTDVPTEVSELLANCLKKEAKRRPSAGEAAESIREILFGNATRPADEEGPFRGLFPFTERHADLFFGREAEIAAFVERVRLQPVLPVVGPSGVGKSSFVQAGVLPRLREQGAWLIIKVRPGNRPFDTLANRLLSGEHNNNALPSPKRGGPSDPIFSAPPPSQMDAGDALRLADELRAQPRALSLQLRRIAQQLDTKVLLYVNQLEELFTSVDDDDVRRDFMRAICTAADDAQDPVRVIFTARDDYLGRLATGPEVTQALAHVTVVRSLRDSALEEVLVRPVEAVGYRYEDASVPRDMVKAVRGERGSLPLLQFAARRLWELRDKSRRVLLRSAYEEMGGVEGALAKHADGVLDAMSAAEAGMARELLLRLVTPEKTRRRVSKSDALTGLDAVADQVLGRLTDARLVTVSKRGQAEQAEALLELAHESLIERWGTLERWLDESREERAFLTEAGQAAELWDKRGRRPEELWRGAALSEASRMFERCSTEAPEKVVAFLEAARDREQSRLRRKRLILGSVFGILASIAAASVMVALFVADKEREALEQRDHAVVQRAGALREGALAALGQGSVLESRAKLRLSLEAEDSASGRALWWRLSSDARVWTKDMAERVYGLSFSPDGSVLAAGNHDEAVYLFDVTTRSMRVLHGNGDQVSDVDFSPDGELLVAATYAGELRIWDRKTSAVVQVLSGHDKRINSVRFSPDGRLLASAADDDTVRLWDARAGKPLKVLSGNFKKPWRVRFSRDGQQVAVASNDGVVRLWSPTTGKLLRELEGHVGAVRGLAFGTAGRLLASADGEKVIVRDLSTGTVRRELMGHSANIEAVEFVDGDKMLAAGSRDGAVRLFNMATGKLSRTLRGHDKTILTLGTNARGTMLASSGFDNRIQLWKVDGAEPLAAGDGELGGSRGLSFSPGGKLLASGSYDAKVRLWEVASGRLVRELEGHSGRIFAVRFSPDGGTLASSSSDWSVRLWDVVSGRHQRMLVGHSGQVTGLAFRADGKVLASASKDGTVRLWDLETGQARVLEQPGDIYEVAFSPDGTRLLTTHLDKTARLWDTDSGEVVKVMRGHSDTVMGAVFDQSSAPITASIDGTVRIWDLLQNSSRIIGRHPERVYWIGLHSDGKHVGASGSDGIGRIWNISSGQQVELRGHRDEVNNVEFSPDGVYAATSSDDGTVRIWHAADGRPHWRAPAVLRSPVRLYSHRGWHQLDSGVVTEPAKSDMRTALEQRAALSQISADGQLLCVLTRAGSVELWEVSTARKLAADDGASARHVVVHGEGCAALTPKVVRLLSRDGEVDTLSVDGVVTALGASTDGLLVGSARGITVIGRDGKVVARHPAGAGVSALGLVQSGMVVGYRDGNIELAGKGDAKAFSFQAVPSSPALRILQGPMNTVIVGYANGLVGLWDTRDGTRLASARLHGQIVHLLMDGDRLYAASDLGRHLVWDLSTLHQDYCKLMRQMWEQVPVVWESGQPRERPAPAGHRCAR